MGDRRDRSSSASGIAIRPEGARDALAVREVNERAFSGSTEADLVEAIRKRGAVTLSLVAIEGGRIVGHALFTPVEIDCGDSTVPAVGLGPMAVLPSRQKRGIGTLLLNHGLERLRDSGHGMVVVLGHPSYYPRFGFLPASRFGIGCEFEVPDDAFMALELRPDAWPGKSGTARYLPEFGGETHDREARP